ncbi:amidohydrolase [Streptomyces mutabilis]|uniref:amidohydrolase n=1 Tax=Streptomyces mutabilis TaxID=67332 RepID=UPI0022BA65B7|nr:amidohydrolase [Streptomyces mutabilis]MCZ9354717.1 amidohydrolase [Streptomyces mutabilis]
MDAYADLVFLGGRVVTVDAEFSVASALAVTGGIISAVGERDDVAPLVGPGTRVIDLRGATLLPGINDSHLHGCAFGMATPPLSLDLGHPAVSSLADVAEAVREAAGRVPDGQWITGHGWDTGYLDECVGDPSRLPSRSDLDAVSPGHPVVLYSFSGHATWVNSKALELIGIDRHTVAPPGGAIVVDETGEPTGLLHEGAQALVQNALPPLSRQERTDAIRSALAKLARLGVTSYTEPGLGPGGDGIMRGALGTETLDVYRRLLADGELTARLGVLLLPSGMASTAEEFARGLTALADFGDADPRRLAIHGVKIFADGVVPNKTAWMHEPYVGGGCGSLCVGGETEAERVAEIEAMIRHAHTTGYQLGVHVTGDRGIDTVADAFAAAMTEHPRPDARHYVIHGDFLTAHSMKVLAAHGCGVNMNPTIKWTVADMEETFVGAGRAAYAWPYRDAIDAGVRVASGSDAPVTYPDWRQGVATMVLRESKAAGRVSGPEQRIGLAEALRTYTIDAAWQDFADDWKGSLEPGKVADLCVLDGDLLTADPHDIPEMPVVLTVVDGQVVHDTLRD